MIDYSSGLNALNQGIATLGKGIDQWRQRETLANLGQRVQAGDYEGAAQAAFASGDAATGLGILKLGQTQKQESDWLKANSGILGGGAAPTVAAPQGSIPLVTSGDRSQPRGIRNNNPGNIEAGDFTAGQTGFKGSDGRFAVFETPEQGIMAADRLLQSYAGRGLNTVAGIVNRWAPPSENNTGAYVASVARELGVDPNAPLDMSSPEVRQKLITAKIRVENGRQPYAADVFARAYGGGKPAPVQVAENEADVQRLEAAQADAASRPAANAANAQGFAIPGADSSIANDPRVMNLQRALAGAPERFKPSIQSRLNILVEELKSQRQETAPTDAVRNYRFYRQEEQAAGREPMSFQQFRESTKSQTNVNVGGGSDKQIFDTMEKGADAAQTAANGLQSIREARRAVEAGGFFGAGADLKLGLQKAAAGFGIGDPETQARIINTETFRSAIAPQIAATMKATVGSANISNSDREFAEKAAGGSITLDANSIKRLLGIMEKANTAIIERHQKRLDTVYPGAEGKFARERALFGVQMPQAEEQPQAPAPRPQAPAAQPVQRPATSGPITATHPQTGKKLMLTPNGTWEPIDG